MTQSLIKLLKNQLLPFFFLFLVIIMLFGGLPKTFYQQDEWMGLGLTLSEGPSTIIFNGVSNPLDFLFVKGRILSNAIYYLFASSFPLQNVQMAIFAIFLHIIATYLVFILIEKFIRNRFISFLGALFFAVNAVSHGAVTWPFVAIGAVGSSIFVLLAILFFFRYIEHTRSEWLFLTGLVLYVSLWFKETGLYLFVFFPLAALLFKSYKPKLYLKQFWWFVVPFLLITGYRILELRLRTTDSNLYITGANENFFLTILIRLVLYPLTSFSLMFVPGEQFLSFAREVLRDNYSFFSNSPENILIAQSAILDLLAVILTSFIILVIFLFLRKEKSENSKAVVFWLTFTLLSFSPYVLLDKDFSYLESRYYYLPVAGGALLFSWLLQRTLEAVGQKIFLGVAVPICALYLIIHASVVHKAIANQVILSELRKDFITELKTQVPTLDNKKNVFYTTSDKNYWVDTNMLPFQQGSGYTLMVLYYNSGKIPKEFFKEGYLFEIGSQGYREQGDFGFGFFWDREELNKAVKFHDVPQSSIIRLNYDSKEEKLSRY